MGGPGEFARSSGRLRQICGAGGDLRSVRLSVLEELSTVVAFDAYAWLLTDPTTSVGVSPLADVPCLPELGRLIRLKYLSEINRWTALADGAVGLLTTATGGDLARSALWRELLSQYEVSDVASMAFKDRWGCWGFLDLWRTGGGVFTRGEAAFLAGIAAPVTAALRVAQAATFLASGGSADQIGPAVLLLSSGGDVLAQTSQTREFLRVLVPPASDQAPIPASAYNVAGQLVAVEQGVDSNPPSARVHLVDGRWMTLRAARIGESDSVAQRDIAVTIEQSSAAERIDLFARCHALSRRETELLEHLTAGTGTRELARRLFVSENTVQDHLKSVFAKTSTRSRSTLLSRALGNGASPS